MNRGQPLVTVAMPVYNGGPLLRDSVVSALASDYPNIELLVLDDASTDGSLALLASIEDPRIRLLRNERNTGLVAARRRLMAEAMGDFVAWLDQDDIAYPERFRVQTSYLLAHPDTAACGSFPNFRIHGADGSQRLRIRRMPTDYPSVLAHLPFTNPVNFSTAMVNRTLVTTSGLDFRDEFGNSLDYDLWSRLASQMPVSNIPRVLGEYRVHVGQTSRGEALSLMERQAWQVQRQTIARDLGISLPDSTDHVHFRLCLRRSSMVSPDDLLAVGVWLRCLADANRETRSYDASAFQSVLAHHWLGAVAHFIRIGQWSTVAGSARGGFAATGLSASATLRSGWSTTSGTVSTYWLQRGNRRIRP